MSGSVQFTFLAFSILKMKKYHRQKTTTKMAEFILGLMFGILKLAQDTIYFKDEILLIFMQASLSGLISILKKGTPYVGYM